MSGSMPLSRASLHAIRIFPIRFWPTKQPTVAYSPRRIRSCSRLIAALDKPRALSFFFKRVSRRLNSSLRVPHFVAVRPVWKMLSSIITASDGSDNSKRRKSSLPRHFCRTTYFIHSTLNDSQSSRFSRSWGLLIVFFAMNPLSQATSRRWMAMCVYVPPEKARQCMHTRCCESVYPVTQMRSHVPYCQETMTSPASRRFHDEKQSS